MSGPIFSLFPSNWLSIGCQNLVFAVAAIFGRRRKSFPCKSGGHGIVARAFSQLFSSPKFTPQVLKSQAVALFWTLAVICGCLGLIGITFSTISAQFKPVAVLARASHSGTRRRVLRRGRRSLSRNAQDDSVPTLAGSYARYSSDMQREESIEDQRRKCREWAIREGMQIVPGLEFADEAVSGTKRHREGLDAMLAAVAIGRIQVLLFHSLSRLARESVITMPLLKELVYIHGVRIISVTEGIDSNREGWDTLATILSLQHEHYVKDLSDNVSRGQEGNVLAGLSVGDYCFGFTSVPVSGSEQGRGRNARPRMVYAKDQETAAWVVRIFHWFVVERRGLRWIARELNRLGAPKDHRSTTPLWHHQYLPRLLRNRKYIGFWSWGQKENVRNPLTGQVRQEDRPEEESEKWTRHLPDLQIIENDTFEAAGRRLDENAKRSAGHRGPKGKLRGSAALAVADHPRHLLSLLICCQACGARFYAGGANGKYLFCPNHHRGTCQCHTQLNRERAERMILEAIGRRILEDPAWMQAVLDATLAAWAVQRHERPGEIQQLENAVETLDRRIARLVDQVENGELSDVPEIKLRLRERCAERDQRAAELEQLRAKESRAGDVEQEPTAEWVAQQLANLSDLLRAGTPAAAYALRDLVGGQIVVEEIREPGKKRHYLRGRFTIRSNSVAKVACTSLADATPDEGNASENLLEEFVIDFVDPDPNDELAEVAKRLYDGGLANKQIAKEMKLHRSQVTMLLQHWSELHGEQLPDGRSRRWTLPQMAEDSPEYQKIADEAVTLMGKGYSSLKIGRQLGCSGTTVDKAITWWHTNRGLPVPTTKDRRLARAQLAKSLRDDGLPIEEIKRILECSTTTLYRLLGIADSTREEPGPGDTALNQTPPEQSPSEDAGESGL
jgi:DNA invertase Pin-like site-specific DNA recombinase